jgi:hypothetical protein
MRRIKANTAIERSKSEYGISSNSFSVKDTLRNSDTIKEEKAFFLLLISSAEIVYFWGYCMILILA